MKNIFFIDIVNVLQNYKSISDCKHVSNISGRFILFKKKTIIHMKSKRKLFFVKVQLFHK